MYYANDRDVIIVTVLALLGFAVLIYNIGVGLLRLVVWIFQRTTG